MAKQDVIKAVHVAMGATVTQENIGKVLEATFDVIKGLGEDQSCRIKDFGTFKVKMRAARKSQGLNNSGPTTIPARLGMTFKIASNFKESLNAPKKKAKKGKKK